MCGIIGYVGGRDAVPLLLSGLRRLEYRGYDSAGLAIINGRGLEVVKSPGKIAILEGQVACAPLHGHVGIGHTRWATHGRPTERNAHPHVDCSARVAVVHNGIIENHAALRAALLAAGHQFRSQTDSEVIAHLIERHLDEGLVAAVRRATAELRGTFAIACVLADDPSVVVAARSGHSPLVIGLGDGETFLASDLPALVGMSTSAVVLGDGEIAELRATGATFATLAGQRVERDPTPLGGDSDSFEKGVYPHFMLKEIHEQPDAVRNTLAGRVNPVTGEFDLQELPGQPLLTGVRRVRFVACGTSWHAGLIGAQLIEAFTGLPATSDVASEFRAGGPGRDDRNVLTIAISQSGETADTLSALHASQAAGSRTIGICNVAGSSLARLADAVVQTHAGVEIGVASTKAFTAQLAAVTLTAIELGLSSGRLGRRPARALVRELWTVPALMAEVLEMNDRIRDIAALFADRNHVIYLGRGLHYPMALEGALKLKEVSYVHADGYPAGEMKHGPIALIESGTPVVCLALSSPTSAKTAGNIEEVKARGGIVVGITTAGDSETARLVDLAIALPASSYWLQPMLAAIPLQLLAYHIGVIRGCDVDQPRNLAKSVTVE